MKDMFNSNSTNQNSLSSFLSGSNNQISGSSSNQQSGDSSNITSLFGSASTTAKPEGIIGIMSDMAKKGKEAIKDVIEPKKEDGSRGSLGESIKEGTIDKVTRLASKGTDLVKDKIHAVEDKAKEVTDKISKTIDEHLVKPIQSTGGSGQKNSEGQMSSQATANAQSKGSEKKQENEQSGKSSNSKDADQNDNEKSLALEVFDKAHEISKIPVETVLKPIDKLFGYEKDPLLKIYDNSHEILRKPISFLSKPVESVFNGAFKTSDEAKKDFEKVLATSSEQERKESKLQEEKDKKANRSIAGHIIEKTVDLAIKPIEIALKPIDHLFGFDKSGKKNPLLHVMEELYLLSKRPVDKFAKPFESILKKMADGEQSYQVGIRFNADKNDPKLFTRLADGYLNIADRVITKPLELFLKPLDHVLGFDEPGKKNPILNAAHALKNATKVGVELFTKPIDRIIRDIAEIGEYKNESEREAFYQRQKEEASRLVKVLDKMHELAQAPFEIVLRPVSKILGKHKEGRKDPFLRAWDIIHQVLRTPWQVVSKPIEDAILGERPKKGNSTGDAQSRGALGSMLAAGKFIKDVKEVKARKNIFIEKIKKVEQFALRPLGLLTAPIRRLLLGEDSAKVGSITEKLQAKAKAGDSQASASSRSDLKDASESDKIIKTLDNINNVILKPFEVMTQPLADIISSDKGENKIDKLKQQLTPNQEQSNKNQTQQAPPSFQARAQAAQKKN